MPDRILVPLIVACALFMQNLDSTVISTALPAIAEDFGTSPIHLKLALTTYLLTIAVFLPASGWLADRFGARLIFRTAILIFTAGSILCGLSNSIAMLVFARVVQGVGGSMMVPVGRLVILRTVSKADLVSALSWLTVPALVGPVVGPPVGGFLTTYASWEWIFWINIPPGILGFALATLFIPDVRMSERVNFDVRGFVLSGIGLATLMAGSTTLGLHLFPVLLDIALIVAGAVLLIAYIMHSRRSPHPILNLSLFSIPTFRHSTIGAFLFRIGMGATPFLLPLLLQIGFGMTAFQSGTITFAAAAGSIAMKFVAPPVLRRYGFRWVLVANTFVSAIFVALPGVFTPSTPTVLMTTLLLIGGFFRSIQFTAINALSFADIPPTLMSQATTLTAVGQQISLSLGISIGAISLELAAEANGGAITADVFWPAFAVIGLFTLASLIPFRQLEHDAGRELSGHAAVPAAPAREPG
jgi:EmrB/QacA subfamily drug resistance transporter